MLVKEQQVHLVYLEVSVGRAAVDLCCLSLICVLTIPLKILLHCLKEASLFCFLAKQNTVLSKVTAGRSEFLTENSEAGRSGEVIAPEVCLLEGSYCFGDTLGIYFCYLQLPLCSGKGSWNKPVLAHEVL